ncbi:hypothetical protein SCLCIDRAFT_1223101 [Scleroderma citrinum Foug A]|uniref:Uncharacterized protein n=1 Tax=Scleroderma citrinum Foug A TaxID=1036808 RepID=A0A0C2YTY2_9AGAM|nr:hypothetical protein SCLCIDRAFT_1223101 [Scleroderma citrinum Foug A]
MNNMVPHRICTPRASLPPTRPSSIYLALTRPSLTSALKSLPAHSEAEADAAENLQQKQLSSAGQFEPKTSSMAVLPAADRIVGL